MVLASLAGGKLQGPDGRPVRHQAFTFNLAMRIVLILDLGIPLLELDDELVDDIMLAIYGLYD